MVTIKGSNFKKKKKNEYFPTTVLTPNQLTILKTIRSVS